MDNEEPWKPPIQENSSEIFRIAPEVPELTIIGIDKTQTPKNNNFIQRVLGSSEHNKFTNKNNSIGPALRKSPMTVNNKQQAFSPSMDLRRNIVNSVKNKGEPPILSSIPLVPDITLLDDKCASSNSTDTPPSRRSTDRVFTESYKEMLVNSHEQFLKQLNAPSKNILNKPIQSYKPAQNSEQKRSQVFGQKTTVQFRQNPLSKYVPSCDQIATSSSQGNNANTSSILIDINQNGSEKNHLKTLTEENDDVTFKKVAEMLSEIQKLVIPSNNPADETPKLKRNDSNGTQDQFSNAHEILRYLARTYLHPDEIIKYNVEEELDEMAKRN